MEKSILTIAAEENIGEFLLSPDAQEMLSFYSEIAERRLNLQMAMLQSLPQMKGCKNFTEILQSFSKLSQECRELFSEFERLIRLLLVVPASNATAERSFSQLRRLKTWLRSSMQQQRLVDLCIFVSIFSFTG